MSKVCNLINDKYFDWMCGLVYDNRYTGQTSYNKLLTYLHERDFTYILEYDSNRAEDGVYLRYRFACDHRRYDDTVVLNCLDRGPSSVLEMLVALALRCEEDMMDDLDLGNRTGKWFWGMIFNLGLRSMSDSRYDERQVERIIDKFLKREYEPNGKGGLFTINDCGHDLRTVEIWHQMCWYLNDI